VTGLKIVPQNEKLQVVCDFVDIGGMQSENCIGRKVPGAIKRSP